jgi:alkylation response protein AidB-like acyl-CoA dehydrogenase
MDAPGIEVRPIVEMAGHATFNEVFFTDVRIPAENLVGELNDGWRLAKVTLGNERVSLSTGGVLWGGGPTALELIEAVRNGFPDGLGDPHLRQRVARVYTEHVVLDLIRLRTLSATVRGEQPGPEASVRKILADLHGQHVMQLARDVLGASSMLAGHSRGDAFRADAPMTDLSHPGWHDGFLFSQALTIGGGTGAVQRNIIGERVLGLPHDIDVTQGLTWAEAQRASGRAS